LGQEYQQNNVVGRGKILTISKKLSTGSEPLKFQELSDIMSEPDLIGAFFHSPVFHNRLWCFFAHFQGIHGRKK